MRRAIFFLTLLFISVWIGLWLHQKPGYIFMSVGQWSIEMPLWFGILAAIAAYTILSILSRLFRKITHLGGALQQLKTRIQWKYSHRNTRKGLIEFSEGKWKQAEHHLIKALPLNAEASLLNYLAAARSAQELGAPQRRDHYLREAQKAIPDAKIAIELTQAQLQIANEQWEQALATLNHLHSLEPHHPYVMKLLIKVYLALKDWPNLEKWLPDIRRNKIMNKKDLQRLEYEVYSGILEQAAKHKNLESAWNNFPKAIRQTTPIVTHYIRLLIEQKNGDTAECCCREALKRHWDNQLIELYGKCESHHPEQELRFAEPFLKHYPNHPQLLLTLGRICLRRQLWGKAKNYLLKSAQILPDMETYAELARLFDILNEKNLAGEYYKKSVVLALSNNQKNKKTSTALLDNFYLLAGKMVF